MNILTSIIAMAPQGGAGAEGGSPYAMPIMVVVMIGIVYFMMIRPQQKRQKDHKNMIEAIKKGDKVVTNAGIHGTVTGIEESVIEVQIADNVRIKLDKTAVMAKN